MAWAAEVWAGVFSLSTLGGAVAATLLFAVGLWLLRRHRQRSRQPAREPLARFDSTADILFSVRPPTCAQSAPFH
jgi:hypothetical protein